MKKKLISKDKVVNLIKAGAFDRIEKRPRPEILKDYINNIAETKQKLTLQNFMMLIRSGLVPDNLAEEVKCYNFTKYIRKNRYDKYYVLDDIAKDYILERFPGNKIQTIKHKDGFEIEVIGESWWDGIYNAFMNNVRSWIKSNHDDLLHKLNDGIFSEEYEKIC